ncbi:MAG: BRCT domain-containing protein, partial [Candidatus Roizmanbacteria bacterium]
QENDVAAITKLISKINSFGTVYAEQIAKGFAKFSDFITTLPDLPYGTNCDDPEDRVDGDVDPVAVSELQGKNCILTGFRNTTIQDFIVRCGGIILKTLSVKTDILITKDASYTNTKTVKAAERGATIISREDFEARYNLQT